MAMNKEIVAFANNKEAVTDYFSAVQDYEIHRFSVDGRKVGDYDHSHTLQEKGAKLNSAFLSAVEARSGINATEVGEAFFAHPSVKWAALSLVEATINSLLPITTFPNMGDFVDFRTVGYGDIVHFKVMPRELFTVSLGN